MRVLRTRFVRRGVSVSLLFEKRDLWVGVYWDHRRWVTGGSTLTVYVCLVPCLPVRVSVSLP